MLNQLKTRISPLLKNPYINRLRGVPFPNARGDGAQNLIQRSLRKGEAVLVARVGETEGGATAHYIRSRRNSKAGAPDYPLRVQTNLKALAGFFPINNFSIDRLCSLYINSIEEIDVYAAWTPHDALLKPQRAQAVRLVDLDPFFTTVKWTHALEGKRVCIVNPFVETMSSQFEKRQVMFKDMVLPDFDICFVKPPVTNCETDTLEQDWFENLEATTNRLLESAPDIAIIGAGAYGLPIGAAAKRNGISAIVLGGSTQLLFGIIGRRWESDPVYRRLFNEYWVRPSEEERPPGYQKFEISGGAYW